MQIDSKYDKGDVVIYKKRTTPTTKLGETTGIYKLGIVISVNFTTNNYDLFSYQVASQYTCMQNGKKYCEKSQFIYQREILQCVGKVNK